MKQIKIFDTTLRDGEQSPGCSMHLNEKIDVALQLEKLGVDILEAGFAVSSKGDFESVKTVAGIIKNASVASLARAVNGDIDAAYEALKGAVAPRIHIFLATSPLHREFKLKMSKEQVLERAAAAIKYAKTLVSDIEFSAEDAGRTEPEFLAEAVRTAIAAGATVINIPDTVGYKIPSEMSDIITYLKKHVENIDLVDISAHNHNDMGMAVANSLAMVKAGATQIECTVNGIGERAGNTSLEEVVMAIRTRRAFFDAYTNVNTKEIYRTSKLISSITGVPISPTKPIVGANAFAHESGIHQHGVLNNPETYEIFSPEIVGVPTNKLVLGKHSGRHAFTEHLKGLGYQLSKEDIDTYFEKFKALADRKKTVTDKDLEAIISDNQGAHPAGFSLEGYSIASGTDGCRASVTVKGADGALLFASEDGNGPVDSAFKAVNSACATDATLLDYSISAVTEGEDALGTATVKIRQGAHVVIGRGVSTDTMEAGIKAYIDGINKLSELSAS